MDEVKPELAHLYNKTDFSRRQIFMNKCHLKSISFRINTVCKLNETGIFQISFGKITVCDLC